MRKAKGKHALAQQLSLGRAFDLLEENKSSRSQIIFRETAQMLENKGVRLFAWWHIADELISRGWGIRKAKYIAWKSLPRNQRWPKTQEEFAQKVLNLGSEE